MKPTKCGEKRQIHQGRLQKGVTVDGGTNVRCRFLASTICPRQVHVTVLSDAIVRQKSNQRVRSNVPNQWHSHWTTDGWTTKLTVFLKDPYPHPRSFPMSPHGYKHHGPPPLFALQPTTGSEASPTRSPPRHPPPEGIPPPPAYTQPCLAQNHPQSNKVQHKSGNVPPIPNDAHTMDTSADRCVGLEHLHYPHKKRCKLGAMQQPPLPLR